MKPVRCSAGNTVTGSWSRSFELQLIGLLSAKGDTDTVESRCFSSREVRTKPTSCPLFLTTEGRLLPEECFAGGIHGVTDQVDACLTPAASDELYLNTLHKECRSYGNKERKNNRLTTYSVSVRTRIFSSV
jgi:hypothetical protein